jgi:competence protein ComFC
MRKQKISKNTNSYKIKYTKANTVCYINDFIEKYKTIIKTKIETYYKASLIVKIKNTNSDFYPSMHKHHKLKSGINEIPKINVIKEKNNILYLISQWVSSILFPAVCVFCGEAVTSDLPLEHVCRKCTAKIPLRPPNQRFIKCVEKSTEIYQSNFVKEANIKVMVACYYEEPLKRALVALKFYDAAYYKNAFGSIVAFVFKDIISDYDYLIPMPLHRRRLKERGYNQASLLAEKISELTSVPLMKNCLVRKNYTKRQSEMTNKEMRIGNVSDAFYCEYPELIFDKRVLIIDDVMTSGATLYCAAKELQESVGRYCTNNPGKRNEFRINGLTLTSNR